MYISLQEWANTVKGKALGFSALAQYHKAVDNGNSKNIGLLL